jgi:hypothetical protein
MTRGLAGSVAVFVAVASVGCGSSPSTVTAPATPAAAAARSGWSQSATAFAAALAPRGVVRKADIDGFRVHPDPGDDGIIRVFEGERVVVNAADVASRPPAPETHLIVNWGEDPNENERVPCGPCRLEHAYAVGRYTLVATADDLQPEGAPGRVNRSITVTIDVAPIPPTRPTPVSPFASFGFKPSVLSVGEFGVFFLPPAFLSTLLDDATTTCTPPVLPFTFSPLHPVPGGFAIDLQAVTPGQCTLTVFSHDADGNVFVDSSTLTVVP